ncbi:MAG: PTS sugar transporter subunit IIA, partial [Thiomonas arsenitoxydans]|nr:PTS sugar transporter subunit IIA [Thiomonas arsenitoxydans]
MSVTTPQDLLTDARIRLGARPETKEDAIREACQLLIASGCVAPEFTASVLEREKVANTFLGHGVSIPHSLGKDRDLIQRDGIAVLQVPQGVEWNPGQTARLVVAIAAKSDSHIAILRRLTRLMQDDMRLSALFSTLNPSELASALRDDTVSAGTSPAVDL